MIKNAESLVLFLAFSYLRRKQNGMFMDAVLNLNYSQILSLVKQLPIRTQLRLGRILTKDATRAELEHFLETFRTDELSEEDILAEVKQVRKERYAKRKKETGHC